MAHLHSYQHRQHSSVGSPPTYEGRITGRGGVKQSFHASLGKGDLPLAGSGNNDKTMTVTSRRRSRTIPKTFSSSSSLSTSGFDLSHLDYLRRHQALLRKRDEQMKVLREKEEKARDFKARPLPGFHLVQDERREQHQDDSPHAPHSCISSSSSSSSGSSSYCTRSILTENDDDEQNDNPSFASFAKGDEYSFTRRRRTILDRRFAGSRSRSGSPSGSFSLLERGGMLERQREWEEVRARKLEEARAIKAAKEMAEVRDKPDLAEARHSWAKAKAEYEGARSRALRRETQRQELQTLKQKAIQVRCTQREKRHPGGGGASSSISPPPSPARLALTRQDDRSYSPPGARSRRTVCASSQTIQEDMERRDEENGEHALLRPPIAGSTNSNTKKGEGSTAGSLRLVRFLQQQQDQFTTPAPSSISSSGRHHKRFSKHAIQAYHSPAGRVGSRRTITEKRSSSSSPPLPRGRRHGNDKLQQQSSPPRYSWSHSQFLIPSSTTDSTMTAMTRESVTMRCTRLSPLRTPPSPPLAPPPSSSPPLSLTPLAAVPPPFSAPPIFPWENDPRSWEKFLKLDLRGDSRQLCAEIDRQLDSLYQYEAGRRQPQPQRQEGRSSSTCSSSSSKKGAWKAAAGGFAIDKIAQEEQKHKPKMT